MGLSMSVIERQIKRKFNQACVDYHLLEDGDRILVGLSGGKDSLLLTMLLAERSRIFKPKFTVDAVHVIMDNIPYDNDCSWLQQYCQSLGIRLHVLHSHFDESTDPRKTRCFLCAWNRRKAIFGFAQENGYNKVALGHHQDDILTTWLMNITYEGNASPTMLPVLPLEHYPVSIIRPLCLVQEQWVEEYSIQHHLVHQKRACPYEQATRRAQMSQVFHHLEALNPEARHSMWRAMMP